MRVRGDNVGALTLAFKMRPGNMQQAIIARELAVITSRAAFPPAVLHTPGFAHKIADKLSRVHDPHGKQEAHAALDHAKRVAVLERTRSWYRTILER